MLRASWIPHPRELAGMDRRHAVAFIAGFAAMPPFVAVAQPRPMQVIGLLIGQPSGSLTNQLVAFRQGLAQAGFVEGRNLAIVYRSAEGVAERLPALAAELVNIPVQAIAAVGGDVTVLSAKAATSLIPIVFATGGDPVEVGIVASLNRPGGNVTGATFLGSMTAPKQISLLHDFVPNARSVGILITPTNPMSRSIASDSQAAAQSLGFRWVVEEASNQAEIDAAFGRFVEQKIELLLLGSGVVFNRYRERLLELAARHRTPAIYTGREFVDAGGLMSYGAASRDTYHASGRLCRAYPEGGQAGGPACGAADAVRACHQPENRCRAWN
jgi:putative ABC transport system substrate-binding protein